MNVRFSQLLQFALSFTSLLMISISTGFADGEFFPVELTGQSDWAKAREEILMVTSRDPQRPVLSLGFQEALELAFSGAYVVYTPTNPHLAQSFEKIIQLAKDSNDYATFIRKIQDTFTDMTPKRERTRLKGPHLDVALPSSMPDDPSVEALIRRLELFGERGYLLFKKGIAEQRVKSRLTDWTKPFEGERVRADLGGTRAALIYTAAFSRSDSIFGSAQSPASPDVIKKRQDSFQKNLGDVLFDVSQQGSRKAKVTDQGYIANSIGLVAAGRTEIRLARAYEDRVRETSRYGDEFSSGKEPKLLAPDRRARGSEETSVVGLDFKWEETPVRELFGRHLEIISKRTGEILAEGDLYNLVIRDAQLELNLMGSNPNVPAWMNARRVLVDPTSHEIIVKNSGLQDVKFKHRKSDGTVDSISLAELQGKRFKIKSRATGRESTVDYRVHFGTDPRFEAFGLHAYRVGDFDFTGRFETLIPGRHEIIGEIEDLWPKVHAETRQSLEPTTSPKPVRRLNLLSRLVNYCLRRK